MTIVDGFVGGPNGENDWVFLSGTQDPEALQQIVGFGDRSCGRLRYPFAGPRQTGCQRVLHVLGRRGR